MIDCFQHLSLQMFFLGYFHSIIHCFCSTTALVLYIFSSSTAFSLKISQKPSRSFTSCAPVNLSTPSLDPRSLSSCSFVYYGPAPPQHVTRLSTQLLLHTLSVHRFYLRNMDTWSLWPVFDPNGFIWWPFYSHSPFLVRHRQDWKTVNNQNVPWHI